MTQLPHLALNEQMLSIIYLLFIILICLLLTNNNGDDKDSTQSTDSHQVTD